MVSVALHGEAVPAGMEGGEYFVRRTDLPGHYVFVIELGRQALDGGAAALPRRPVSSP